MRRIFLDHRDDGLEQEQQPLGEGQGVARSDHAVADMDQPRAVHRHHAPAGAAQAGVEPKDANRVRHVFPPSPGRVPEAKAE